uniref:Uncharacterized protein n=1 Tax=viral metagenome TaxID=1070528 RepID=A0A6M3KC42_9ZZZZ
MANRALKATTNGGWAVEEDGTDVVGSLDFTNLSVAGAMADANLFAVSQSGAVKALAFSVFRDAATYTTTFNNGNLVAGVLTVTHSLNSTILHVTVANNAPQIIVPDAVIFTGADTLTVDLTSFGTLSGIWSVRVSK